MVLSDHKKNYSLVGKRPFRVAKGGRKEAYGRGSAMEEEGGWRKDGYGYAMEEEGGRRKEAYGCGSAMEEEGRRRKEPSPAPMLISDHVDNYSFVDKRAFRMVKCGRKEAYGCGSNGDDIVKGLTLFVRIGRDDDPYNCPGLCLSATDKVFSVVGLELDVEKAERCGSHTRLSSRIYTVDGDVMVLCISFIPSFMADEVSYYLVYDSAAESLTLLPRLRDHCHPVCTEFPLKVQVGEEHSNYSLVLMAERSEYKEPVLCLWSLPPSPDDRRRYFSKCAWDLKDRVRVNTMVNPFEAHVVFSFKGNAVWGDLAQGILYCDCRDLIDGPEPVNFKHILLPKECRTTYDKYDIDQDPMPVFRNMSCVGDSIWFVIIQPSFDLPGGTKVKVWTLDLLSEEEWSLHRAFSMQSVWKLELFRAMGLPKTVPEFPILRHDCTMYMILREPYRGGIPRAHLVCIDLSSTYKVRIMSKKPICIQVMERPLLLDPDFFSLC